MLNNNMARNYRKWKDEDLINTAKEVVSMAQFLGKLNLQKAGGNYGRMKHHLQRLSIDISHWTGQGWSKDEQLKDWSEYTRGNRLKPHLIKERGHKCQRCNRTEWEDVPIPLELEHCDGDSTNNSLDNLLLLCCNCHALTPSWRRRKDKS